MRQRRVLVIHDSATVRNIIFRYVQAELQDVRVFEADCGAMGLAKLSSEEYELVLCRYEMEDMRGPDVYRRMREQTRNGETPFLLLTASPSAQRMEELAACGIEHVMTVPFHPKALAERIDALCHPREWREHERHHVPGTRMFVQTAAVSYEGEVVNLSIGGLLGDLPFTSEICSLFGLSEISIVLPDDDPFGAEPIPVPAQFLRMTVTEWETPDQPSRVRIAWRFLEPDPETHERLRETLHAIGRSLQSDLEAGETEE